MSEVNLWSEFSAVQFFSRANFQPCNFSAVQSFTRAASQVSLVCIFCGQQGHVLWKTKVLNDQLQLFQDIQSSKLNSNWIRTVGWQSANNSVEIPIHLFGGNTDPPIWWKYRFTTFMEILIHQFGGNTDSPIAPSDFAAVMQSWGLYCVKVTISKVPENCYLH